MVESNFKPIPDQLLGTSARDLEPAPLPDATWYLAEALGDRLVSHFPTGVLIGSNHLSADTLLDGNHLSVFQIIFQEGETGPEFGFSYGLLNQCQARIRMPLEAVNQNRWMYPREGAWLKPRCKGQRVDLVKVDRMKVVVQRKGPRPVRFDGALVEPGPQAILTGRGILLVYNRCNTGDPDLPPGAYTAVQVLFDPLPRLRSLGGASIRS